METKVPFYNIVNILLPGLVFIGTGIFLFLDKVKVMATPIASLIKTKTMVEKYLTTGNEMANNGQS